MVSAASLLIIAFCPPASSIQLLKQADRLAGEGLLSARTLLLSFSGIIGLIPRCVCACPFTPLPEKESS